MYLTAYFSSLWEQACLIQVYFTFCGVWAGREKGDSLWKVTEKQNPNIILSFVCMNSSVLIQYMFTSIL